MDRQSYGEDDLGSLFSGGGGGPGVKRERERGFTGTALTGDGPPVANSDRTAPAAAAAGSAAAAAAPAAAAAADQAAGGSCGGKVAADAAKAEVKAQPPLAAAVADMDVEEAELESMSAEDKAAVLAAMLSDSQ